MRRWAWLLSGRDGSKPPYSTGYPFSAQYWLGELPGRCQSRRDRYRGCTHHGALIYLSNIRLHQPQSPVCLCIQQYSRGNVKLFPNFKCNGMHYHSRTMGLLRSSCMFCGNSGVEEKCGQCGNKFHADCAREHGSLRIREEGGGLLSSSTVKYTWNCPSCGRATSGQM